MTHGLWVRMAASVVVFVVRGDTMGLLWEVLELVIAETGSAPRIPPGRKNKERSIVIGDGIEFSTGLVLRLALVGNRRVLRLTLVIQLNIETRACKVEVGRFQAPCYSP